MLDQVKLAVFGGISGIVSLNTVISKFHSCPINYSGFQRKPLTSSACVRDIRV